MTELFLRFLPDPSQFTVRNYSAIFHPTLRSLSSQILILGLFNDSLSTALVIRVQCHYKLCMNDELDIMQRGTLCPDMYLEKRKKKMTVEPRLHRF
jgi:hypothetical protein